jgi:rare lipoprotein A
MTPRNAARAVAAGALCFAFTNESAATASAAQEPQIGVNRSQLDVRAGGRAAVSGRVAPAVRGLGIALQVRRGKRWKSIESDRTDATGRYRLRQRLSETLSRHVRVRVRKAPGVLPAERRIGRLNVYRAAAASWYGPGLFGNRTGCGGTLRAGRLGVAHKSLPCGARVTLKHGRRRLRVPVIDRGPCVGGREYDLTAATARRLGFRGHGAILTTR